MSELQRTLISQPMSLTPYPEHRCPHPVDMHSNRIQVTAFFDELGRVVERWQFSDEDVRYYHVEKYVQKKVTVSYDAKAPIG